MKSNLFRISMLSSKPKIKGLSLMIQKPIKKIKIILTLIMYMEEWDIVRVHTIAKKIVQEPNLKG